MTQKRRFHYPDELELDIDIVLEPGDGFECTPGNTHM